MKKTWTLVALTANLFTSAVFLSSAQAAMIVPPPHCIYTSASGFCGPLPLPTPIICPETTLSIIPKCPPYPIFPWFGPQQP